MEIYSTRNSIYSIEEIGEKPKLKRLRLSGKQVDVKGIENFIFLENIYFSESNVINIECLSGLKNVEYLEMMIQESNPDTQFIEGMKNLKYLKIYAANDTWGNKKITQYQVFDLTPIGGLFQLNVLWLSGFILQNVASLDRLDNLEIVYVFDSVFKDESERTEKPLIFHGDR
jgi:Leucine-rich repeat (LRR) protein